MTVEHRNIFTLSYPHPLTHIYLGPAIMRTWTGALIAVGFLTGASQADRTFTVRNSCTYDIWLVHIL